ncbi:MAG: hypothetical protein AAGA85_27280, partial [Bacteroidota bacterium]
MSFLKAWGLFAWALCQVLPSLAQFDTLEVSSERFGRKISVYLREYGPAVQGKPIVYFTDGQKVIDNGLS